MLFISFSYLIYEDIRHPDTTSFATSRITLVKMLQTLPLLRVGQKQSVIPRVQGDVLPYRVFTFDVFLSWFDSHILNIG